MDHPHATAVDPYDDELWSMFPPLPAFVEEGGTWGAQTIEAVAGVCAIGADLLVLWLEDGQLSSQFRAGQMRLALYEGARRRWVMVPEPGVRSVRDIHEEVSLKYHSAAVDGDGPCEAAATAAQVYESYTQRLGALCPGRLPVHSEQSVAALCTIMQWL